MIIVIDTNVLVSGLLSDTGNPVAIVDYLLTAKLKAAYDIKIISEYREVLKRPKFPFKPAEIDALLNYIEAEGLLVYPAPLKINLPDPFDLPFLEVAYSIESKILVTGNSKDYSDAGRKLVKVLTPAEFLTSTSL